MDVRNHLEKKRRCSIVHALPICIHEKHMTWKACNNPCCKHDDRRAHRLVVWAHRRARAGVPSTWRAMWPSRAMRSPRAAWPRGPAASSCICQPWHARRAKLSKGGSCLWYLDVGESSSTWRAAEASSSQAARLGAGEGRAHEVPAFVGTWYPAGVGMSSPRRPLSRACGKGKQRCGPTNAIPTGTYYYYYRD